MHGGPGGSFFKGADKIIELEAVCIRPSLVATAALERKLRPLAGLKSNRTVKYRHTIHWE